MRLSDSERLIVVMLAEIMKKVGADDDLDGGLIGELAYAGDDWAIKRRYSHLFHQETTDSEVVSETTNILWMWGIVEHSISELEGEQAAEAASWMWASFDGFDANHDPHFHVAQTMINRLDEFESFKGRNLNSHSQASLPHYRAMYREFDKLIKSDRASPISFEALKELCS